jgi:hypothetical protein
MDLSDSDGTIPEVFERDLVRALYRFDCPDAHTLGEYQLDLLEEAERVRVAAHAADCDECRAELATLRAFLSAPTTVAEPPLARARRIVATLFAPSPGLAFGGLRGAPESSTQVFEAGDITITLAPGETSGSLVGLVVAANQPPGALQGREVRLLPREGPAIVAVLDDLGNFELAGLPAGQYAVELDLLEGVVVIEEVRVA